MGLAVRPGYSQASFIVGGDLSMLHQIEANGGVFRDDGIAADALEIFKDHGFNWIRLKIWHSPVAPFNDLDGVRRVAMRAKAKGFKFLLNFHYSDTWADPGKQNKPGAWDGLAFDDLVDSLYQYTFAVVKALKDSGAMPDMVQIGNEINCGMLWPDGNVCGGNNTPAHWSQLGRLIDAGIRGVKDNLAPSDTVEILVHHSEGGNNAYVSWFFDNLLEEGVAIDIIGVSFYPKWHGTLQDLEANLQALAGRYMQDIIVAETGYPWTTEAYDGTGNLFGPNDLHPGYPASVSGQCTFLRDLRSIVAEVPDGRGKGIFYWEPDWISTATFNSPWENVALFDFEGNALLSIDALATGYAGLPTVNLTLTVNTATNWDMLNPAGVVQLRGEVRGCTGRRLLDGSWLSWGTDSELIFENAGGDYWTVTVPLYPGDTLAYKLWTGFSLQQGTAHRLGWEGPVTPGNGIPGNTRINVAGATDTTAPIQYYNGSGESVDQYWRPYAIHPDSVAIYYRVNMREWMEAGLFDAAAGDSVGLRGDYPFTWSQTSHILSQEIYSVADGSFWSGVAYVPRDSLNGDLSQTYQFTLTRASGEEIPEGIDRTLGLSAGFGAQDTTLHWVAFRDGNLLSIRENARALPKVPLLLTSYPNPFNAATTIRYRLADPADVELAIFDLGGRLVRRLGNSAQAPGQHRVVWDGRDDGGLPLASGIYFITLVMPGHHAVQKVALLK